jgi:hypothetical protein
MKKSRPVPGGGEIVDNSKLSSAISTPPLPANQVRLAVDPLADLTRAAS